MKGYLRVENRGAGSADGGKSARRKEAGWYDTGDIVTFDEQGYVRIGAARSASPKSLAK